MGKRLDLLAEIVPKNPRFGVLWQSDNVASSCTARSSIASVAA